MCRRRRLILSTKMVSWWQASTRWSDFYDQTYTTTCTVLFLFGLLRRWWDSASDPLARPPPGHKSRTFSTWMYYRCQGRTNLISASSFLLLPLWRGPRLECMQNVVRRRYCEDWIRPTGFCLCRGSSQLLYTYTEYTRWSEETTILRVHGHVAHVIFILFIKKATGRIITAT
jgi:hypothetical protein